MLEIEDDPVAMSEAGEPTTAAMSTTKRTDQADDVVAEAQVADVEEAGSPA